MKVRIVIDEIPHNPRVDDSDTIHDFWSMFYDEYYTLDEFGYETKVSDELDEDGDPVEYFTKVILAGDVKRIYIIIWQASKYFKTDVLEQLREIVLEKCREEGGVECDMNEFIEQAWGYEFLQECKRV